MHRWDTHLISSQRRPGAIGRSIHARAPRSHAIQRSPSPTLATDSHRSERCPGDERVLDAIENAREQMIGTFDVVTTRTTERTNDVMRILTVVSSLLLPSVVIAGVMGMNFQVGWRCSPRCSGSPSA